MTSPQTLIVITSLYLPLQPLLRLYIAIEPLSSEPLLTQAQ